MGIHNFGPSLKDMLKPDVEFVTKVTSDNCVKKNWVRVHFQRITAKNYPICEICQIQARVFTKQLE